MIPHIVKGSGISGAVRYVMGEGNDKDTGRPRGLVADKDSRVAWIDGQGFGFPIDSAERVELARRVMEWSALPQNQASKTRKLDNDCLHLSLSWEPTERPDKKEMLEAAKGALKALGMENARALFVCHEDTDHPHIHIVASRINPDTGKAFSDAKDFAKVQAWALGWEKEHGTVLCAARAERAEGLEAIKARDAAKTLEHVTARAATFTTADLDRLTKRAGLTVEEQKTFGATLLAEPNVIGLRDTPEGDITRYTTRQILAAERDAMRDAQALATSFRFEMPDDYRREALERKPLDDEQTAAFYRATNSARLSIIAGEAGTGKTHTLAAIRDAYEAQGRRVIGLAWTNSVVQDMRADGFKNTSTIAAAMQGVEKGRRSWNANTVLIVDEAAMLATKPLAALLKEARESGAKVILAGDDRQLASIERGGLFTALQHTHGAAELHEVRRVADLDQRRAFNAMHKGDFGDALRIFDQRGGIEWTDTQKQAEAALVKAYAAAVATSPDKARFIFAYTNDAVAALNVTARAAMRESGRLGVDQVLHTATGGARFADGDRIQFTANAHSRTQKEAGIVNGAVGTVRTIEGDRVTVELDSKKGAAPRVVSFEVGEDTKAGQFNSFKHGYAGTIYRGQGRTLDETFVYHSSHWRSASSYVALSRHRDSVALFVAKDTAKDIGQLARQMARQDEKRAAVAFVPDKGGLFRSGLATAEVAQEILARQATPAPAAPTQTAAKGTERAGDKAPAPAAPKAAASAPKPTTHAPAATKEPDISKVAEVAARPAAAAVAGAVKTLEGIADFFVGAAPKAPPCQCE